MLSTTQVHSTLHLRSGRHNCVANATTVKQLQLGVLKTAQPPGGVAEWQHSQNSWVQQLRVNANLAMRGGKKKKVPGGRISILAAHPTSAAVCGLRNTDKVWSNCYNSELGLPSGNEVRRLHNGQVLECRISVNGGIAQGNERLVAKATNSIKSACNFEFSQLRLGNSISAEATSERLSKRKCSMRLSPGGASAVTTYAKLHKSSPTMMLKKQLT